jgi:hypothetical protein
MSKNGLSVILIVIFCLRIDFCEPGCHAYLGLKVGYLFSHGIKLRQISRVRP